MDRNKQYHKSFQSRFQVYRGVVQAIPNGVNTGINFDTVQYDPLDEYDEAILYQFTPLQAGYYLLKAGLTFGVLPIGSIYGIILFVDAGIVHRDFRESFIGTLGIADISRLYYLTPANVVSISAFQASGVGQNVWAGLNRTFLEGFRWG